MLSRANYQEQDILRLARRRDTSKRAYLLVNPLQAKHVPSRPGEALAMMEALGRALAAEYPDTGLVVGFAETATAIGAVTAGFFPADCVYLTTTRERLPEVRDWSRFRKGARFCSGRSTATLPSRSCAATGCGSGCGIQSS